jgi:hypothetical protein
MMYLPTDDEVDVMCEWYRGDGGREPVWVSGDLTLAAGFRLAIYYMQRPDLSLDTVARGLGVQRKKLDQAIQELTSIITGMSRYGSVSEQGNMTPYRLRSAAHRAEMKLANRYEDA